MIIALSITLVLAVLVAINRFALYRQAVRDILAIREYAQFLRLDPESYEDQRRKFVEYVAATTDKTSVQRGADAGLAVTRIARNLREQMILANAAARNKLAQKPI